VRLREAAATSPRAPARARGARRGDALTQQITARPAGPLYGPWPYENLAPRRSWRPRSAMNCARRGTDDPAAADAATRRAGDPRSARRGPFFTSREPAAAFRLEPGVYSSRGPGGAQRCCSHPSLPALARRRDVSSWHYDDAGRAALPGTRSRAVPSAPMNLLESHWRTTGRPDAEWSGGWRGRAGAQLRGRLPRRFRPRMLLAQAPCCATSSTGWATVTVGAKALRRSSRTTVAPAGPP